MPGPVSIPNPGSRSTRRRVLTCAFCGQEYAAGTPATKHKRLTEHVYKCEKHPLKEVLECLRLVLDQVDYDGRPVSMCGINETVGAVLPREILQRARKALKVK